MMKLQARNPTKYWNKSEPNRFCGCIGNVERQSINNLIDQLTY